MVHWWYSQRIGYTYVYENGKLYVGNIFGGNCLCVFTQFYKDKDTGKDMEMFHSFFADEKHLKNFYEHEKTISIYPNLKSVRLNMYFKESIILAKYYAMSGIKVAAYYKEPKKKNNK